MSIKTKERFKNIGKVIAGVLFALLLFTNIKVALMDDAEILSGDISLLGVELTLFDETQAAVPLPCNRILTWADIFFDLPCEYETGGNCCPAY